MDLAYFDGLQRVGLHGLIKEFHQICTYASVWTTDDLAVLHHSDDTGSWRAVRNGTSIELELHFAELTLGSLIIVDEETHLRRWKWGPAGNNPALRMSEGSGLEQRLGSPEGPLPAELFDALWTGLMSAMRSYVAAKKLRPSGLAAVLFLP